MNAKISLMACEFGNLVLMEDVAIIFGEEIERNSSGFNEEPIVWVSPVLTMDLYSEITIFHL